MDNGSKRIDVVGDLAPVPTRKRERRRRTRPRSKTFSRREVAQALKEARTRVRTTLDLEEQALFANRPRTRADCADVPRPCPYVGCKHNNYINVTSAGSLQMTFPDLEPWEVPPASSCALDVAERGGITLEEIGLVTNLTRERVRQIEVNGLMSMRAAEAPHPDGNDTACGDGERPIIVVEDGYDD